MLISAQRLVDRLRHPPSRADDIATVRRKLAEAPGPERVGAAELTAAREMVRLKEALHASLGEVTACGVCARGRPLPHGRWNGGHCCGGRTEGVFTDAEVAALRLSGTTPARLTPPPPSDHAGCAFRGPAGCSLATADRPSLCVHYVCMELEADLRGTGVIGRVKALRTKLRGATTRFERLRAARLEAEAEAEEGAPFAP